MLNEKPGTHRHNRMIPGMLTSGPEHGVACSSLIPPNIGPPIMFSKPQLTQDLVSCPDPASMLRERYAPVFAGLDLDRRLEITRHLREHGLSSALIAAALDVSVPTATDYVKRSGAVEPENLLSAGGYSVANPRHGETNDRPAPRAHRGRPVTPSPRLLLDEATALLARARAIHNTEALSDPRALEAAAMMREAADLIESAAIGPDNTEAPGPDAPKLDA